MTEEVFTAYLEKSSSDYLSPLDQILFQEKVGNILYLASHSRSDLSHATTQLSRKSNEYIAVDRLFNYIFIIKELGLTLSYFLSINAIYLICVIILFYTSFDLH
jgi:hypothetical protein